MTSRSVRVVFHGSVNEQYGRYARQIPKETT